MQNLVKSLSKANMIFFYAIASQCFYTELQWQDNTKSKYCTKITVDFEDTDCNLDYILAGNEDYKLCPQLSATNYSFAACMGM